MQQKCLECASVFSVKQSEIDRGRGKFCSRICFDKYRNMGKFIICTNCGKEKWYPTNRWKRNKSGLFFCSRKCNFEYQKGVNSTLYKNGKYLDWYIHGEKNKWLHRLLVEGYIGRDLVRGEIVHHIDGDRTNNKLNNLYIYTSNGEHIKSHFNGDIENLRSNLDEYKK